MENMTENVEKKFELRPLEGGDIFIMTSIISKVGVKNIAKCFDTDEIKEIRKEIKEKGRDAVDTDEVGRIIVFNVFDLLLERLEYCEANICRLLARLSGKKPEEVKKMGAVEYLDMLMEVVQDKQFTDFFMRAYELLGRMM